MLNLILVLKVRKYITDKLRTIISDNRQWQSINTKDLLLWISLFQQSCIGNSSQQEQTNESSEGNGPQKYVARCSHGALGN